MKQQALSFFQLLRDFQGVFGGNLSDQLAGFAVGHFDDHFAGILIDGKTQIAPGRSERFVDFAGGLLDFFFGTLTLGDRPGPGVVILRSGPNGGIRYGTSRREIAGLPDSSRRICLARRGRGQTVRSGGNGNHIVRWLF